MDPLEMTELEVQILDNLSSEEDLWQGNAKETRLLAKLHKIGWVIYKRQPYITRAGRDALIACDGGVPDDTS